jgi:hypothetical protein
MIYKIKTSVSMMEFEEIRKLKRYDKEAIASAKAAKLTDQVNNPNSMGDLVRCGNGMPLFSEKFVELLKENGVGSFNSFRVELAFQGQNLNYYYVEPSRSLKPIPENRIGPGTLDLNNVFLPGESTELDIVGILGTFELLCGEKVKGLVREAGCTNIEFEPVEYVPFDEDGNPVLFYEFSHGWANKYFWLGVVEPYSEWKDWPHPEIQCTFSRYSGTTVGDAHGSTWARTYVSPRVRDFLLSLGSDMVFHRIKMDSSIQNAELYAMEMLNKIPRSDEPVFEISITGTLKKGCYGDMSSWNGQNPFGIEDTLWVLMNYPAKRLMEAKRFENVWFHRMRYLVGHT